MSGSRVYIQTSKGRSDPRWTVKLSNHWAIRQEFCDGRTNASSLVEANSARVGGTTYLYAHVLELPWASTNLSPTMYLRLEMWPGSYRVDLLVTWRHLVDICSNSHSQPGLCLSQQNPGLPWPGTIASVISFLLSFSAHGNTCQVGI